jgi:uncharacterized protein (DUF1501 family)
MATTRREFLRAGAFGALALGLTSPREVLAAAARPRPAAAAGVHDPVVVAVNLFGGNDGLNTVVPLKQYTRYRQLRPAIGWPSAQLIPLPGHEQDFGLTPGLQPLVDLFRQGKVALINGVGCPQSAQGLFDHEASQQNFQTGDVYGTAPPLPPTGWLGRFLDGVQPAALPAAIDFSGAPLLLSGSTNQPLSLYALDGFGVYPSADYDARLTAYARLQDAPGAGGVADRNRRLRTQLIDLGGALQTISDTYQVAAGVTYPPTYLAGALHDCAALIAADRGVRGLAVGFGGFDTHAGELEGPPDTAPYHAGLWSEVSDAIAAFYADVHGHGIGGRVVVLVFSEFGRRGFENNDQGTDHGFASVALAIGDPVRGGVYGDYPDLRDQYLVLDGNLDVRVDFRSVYATILAKHLAADPAQILGGSFPQLAFL